MSLQLKMSIGYCRIMYSCQGIRADCLVRGGYEMQGNLLNITRLSQPKNVKFKTFKFKFINLR